jgi:hypothetical protein
VAVWNELTQPAVVTFEGTAHSVICGQRCRVSPAISIGVLRGSREDNAPLQDDNYNSVGSYHHQDVHEVSALDTSDDTLRSR